ncbi:MAG: DUF4178 domain-containing protein [Leptospiraceae bacterium]|nr:DUF4178 domain-containing protein [Leptospiraceae bacterium]MCP5512657.1 DUF4178 domain-containing protein [Leptospiraceae bacterium]
MAGNNYISPLSVKTFNCPNCGSNVDIRVQGQSLTVVCKSCKSVIDTSNENYQIVQTVKSKSSRRQVIPFGSRGKIEDTLWEVIGYLEKKDGNYYWSEYLLFNPYKGYRWLVENGGHWNLFRTIKDKPVKNRKNLKLVNLRNLEYSIYNKGNAEVSYVMGEFYWRVRVGNMSVATDYISPPYMLSSEEVKDEIVWSLGKYIESKEVYKIFNVERPPGTFGVAPNQPSPVQSSHQFVKRTFYALLIALFFFQTFFCIKSKDEVVYKNVFEFRKGENDKPKVTPAFEIKNDESNLEISMASPVDNNWVEINLSLVNDTTGDTIDLVSGIEYYHGVDDGESWTEGSQNTSKLLSSIPKGKYHLNVSANSPILDPAKPTNSIQELFKNDGLKSNLDVIVELRSDVTNWSNFFWSLFLILIYPIISFWKNRSFESQRWSNSDFSPY